MILQSNNYYNLASSQLFPFNDVPKSTCIKTEAIVIAEDAFKLVSEKQYTEAIAVYSSAIEKFPEQPFFYASRSIIYTFLEDEESAFYDYQIAKRLDFNYHHYLEWLENKGDMLENDDLVEINQTISTQSDNAQLFINRAMLQVQHFNYAEAISDYTQAFILSNDISILISRAAIYMYVLHYDKALEDLNAVIETLPSVDAYLYRAKLYVAIKEFDEALKNFQSAIELDSQNLAVYEERAQLYEQIEEFDQAIADYSTIINANNSDFYPYVLRADVFEKIDDWNAAIADYTQAISLNPYYSDLYQYRGALLEKIGDEEGARADYAKFEELEAED